MKAKKYELTDKELKLLITYIREEARLSYELKRILWLAKEGNTIKTKILPLAERFRYLKSDLRHNFPKEIYKEIVEKDEVDTKFPVTKLKKEIKDE
jgi:hypothetical protein